jgi:uncharacterized protein DUF6895/PUD1/2-like protein
VGYTNHALIGITSGFPVAIRSVTLRHKYSDDPEQVCTWSNVPANGSTEPTFEVGYNTGIFRFGMDWWHIDIVFEDGVVWSNSGWKECYLTGADDKSNGPLLFKVWGNEFNLNMRSPGCTTYLSGSNGYNSVAFVNMKNDLPVQATIRLTHQYSSDKIQEHTWDRVGAGQTTDTFFPIYFNTGASHPEFDYWNVEVTPNAPPPDNAPDKAFFPVKNAKKDKECFLAVRDVGLALTFSVTGEWFHVNIPSSPCRDEWNTPNGYNTFAFLAIKNDFDAVLRSVELSHQYDNDPKTFRFTRSSIAPGSSSSPPIMVEYNTGILHPSGDYWNVKAFLDNGNWYQNSKRDKECMMRPQDTAAIQTFSVSKDVFVMGLVSGSCKDGMTYGGSVDYNLGRDPKLRYDQNAYLGAHNAFANFAEGFFYAQQSMSIADQMAFGATTLLLDIWDYDNDVYMLHEYGKPYGPFINPFRPFGTKLSLKAGLGIIKDFMTRVPDVVVTIVFEDRVTANRPKIEAAFRNEAIWDWVFFADKVNKGWNVTAQGWPTLEWLVKNDLRLVVFSSTQGPFPDQWRWMSESVYGDESLDPSTWVNKRGESDPLNQLALCALNHFPTLSITGAWLLGPFIERIRKSNATSNLLAQVDDCKKKWSRYPNWLNVDYVEIPTGDVAAAITRLNALLHGKPEPSPKTVGRFVTVSSNTEEAGEDNRLERAWSEAAETVAADLVKSADRLGSASNVIELGNLALVLRALASIPGTSSISVWAKSRIRDLAPSLAAFDSAVDWDAAVAGSPSDMLLALPRLALREFVDAPLADAQKIVALIADPNRRKAAAGAGRLDLSYLLVLAGFDDGIALLEEVGRRSGASIVEGDVTSTTVYDLTHAVLFGSDFGRREFELPTGVRDALPPLVTLIAERRRPDAASEVFAAACCLGASPERLDASLNAILDARHWPDEAVPSGFVEESDESRDGRARHAALARLLAVGLAVARNAGDAKVREPARPLRG